MFVLQIINGPHKGQAVPLVLGRKVLVGRSPVCQLALPDPRVSANHAEVSWMPEGFSVLDLGSANGTFLNGKRVTAREGLKIGDHLQLGDVLIALRDVDLQLDEVTLMEPTQAGVLATLDAGQTQVMQKITIPAAKTGARAKPQAEPELPPVLAMGAQKTQMVRVSVKARVDDQVVSEVAALKAKVETAPEGVKVIVRREERFDPFWSLPVVIGREQSGGVVLDDPSVSLRHAVIDLRDGRYLVRDTGSSNGVYVNQRRVVEQKLEDGDAIGVGSHALLVVTGPACLGIQVQPPGSAIRPASEVSQTRIGVVDQPLAATPAAGAKKKKKKAADLVWYATSDLDRGSFRARSALVALLLGVGLTFWMLMDGDSQVLAGAQLSKAHESERFVHEVDRLGLDRCTACHVGAGQITALKCLDCHTDNRPLPGHATADVACTGCHAEHRGAAYALSAAAAASCAECHPEPHASLKRTRPKLVATFDIDAPADVPFHVRHESQGVTCLRCHAESEHSATRGIRGACGQCHAPDLVTGADCQQCHRAHPDRPARVLTTTVVAAAVAPPRFATRGLLLSLGLLVASFFGALLWPRRRPSTQSTEPTTPPAEPRAKTQQS